MKRIDSAMNNNEVPGEANNAGLLDEEDVRLYQSCIGSLMWIASTSRVDILQAVVMLSRFTAAPRQEHFDRVDIIYRYLRMGRRLQRLQREEQANP